MRRSTEGSVSSTLGRACRPELPDEEHEQEKALVGRQQCVSS